MRGVLEFYQQVLESLNHGGMTSGTVAHRVWFSPDVDQSTRISVIQEMIDRIQTELSIRKFLEPNR